MCGPPVEGIFIFKEIKKLEQTTDSTGFLLFLDQMFYLGYKEKQSIFNWKNTKFNFGLKSILILAYFLSH